MHTKTHRKIHIYVLEIEQDSKKNATSKFITLKACQTGAGSRPTGLTCRAMYIDHSRMPNNIPLYWKCMWSTIRKPGCKKIEAEIIRWVGGSIALRVNLVIMVQNGLDNGL